MAHNLYQDKMAFTGELPWHRLGKRFDNAMTAEEAMEGAGLGYIVTKENLCLENTGERVNAYATYNNDNKKILGFVGGNYEVIQNSKAFQFFDVLTEKGMAIYETAGALGDGEKVWLLAKLPKSFSPVAGDLIEQYCMLTTSHDGSTPCQVGFTPIRVVCQNTLNIALKQTTNIVKVRHTMNADVRLEEAARIIKSMNDYFEQMGEQCHVLANFEIDDDYINDYINGLFMNESDVAEKGPGRAIRQKKIDMFRNRLTNGRGVDLPGVVGTAWWCLNAAVEIADYSLPKKMQDPTETVVYGAMQKLKQKAWDLSFALVGARS